MAVIGTLPVNIKWTFKYDPIAVAYTVYMLCALEYFIWALRDGN